MRIGVNALFLIPGEVGGSETYLRQLLSRLVQDFPDTGFVLFTNAENDASLRDAFGASRQVEFCPLRFTARNRAARIIREQTQLPLSAARAGIDILWSPGYTTPCLASVPRVTTVFDLQYKEFPDDWSRLALLANTILIPMAIRRSRRILALSGFTRAQILKYVPIRPDRIDVTPPAAGERFACPVPEPERSRRLRSLVPSDAPYLLCVANTYPHKNVHALVNTYGRLADRIPHRLVLVGNPGRGESLVREALHRLPCRDRVLRLHHLSDADLSLVYQNADLFVFPSLYEGFGLPVLEAMMSGTPVVATPRAAIPEVGGDAIAYFDDSDAQDMGNKIMDMLAMSKAERERWIRAARARACTFSWKRTADQTMACLQKAAAGGVP